ARGLVIHRHTVQLGSNLDDLTRLAPQFATPPMLILIALNLPLKVIMDRIDRRIQIGGVLFGPQNDSMIAHQRHLGTVHIALTAARLLADPDSHFANLIEIALQLANLLLDVTLLALCDLPIAALDNELHGSVPPRRPASAGRLLGGAAMLHRIAAPNARSPRSHGATRGSTG